MSFPKRKLYTGPFELIPEERNNSTNRSKITHFFRKEDKTSGGSSNERIGGMNNLIASNRRAPFKLGMPEKVKKMAGPAEVITISSDSDDDDFVDKRRPKNKFTNSSQSSVSHVHRSTAREDVTQLSSTANDYQEASSSRSCFPRTSQDNSESQGVSTRMNLTSVNETGQDRGNSDRPQIVLVESDSDLESVCSHMAVKEYPQAKLMKLHRSEKRIKDNEDARRKKSRKTRITKSSPVRHLKKNSGFLSRQNSKQNVIRTLQFPQSSVNEVAEQPPVKRVKHSNSVPYYLENFESVLDTVLADSHNYHLINKEDHAIIQAYMLLTTEAKCLYVRLFHRKWHWKPSFRIKYPEIDDDLTPLFEELCSSKFILKIEDEKQDLDSLLKLLSGEQMTGLSARMGLKASKTKKDCKKNLLKMSRQQMTLSGCITEILYSEAEKCLGPTFKVTAESRNLFARIFSLHSPPQYWENENEQSLSQNQTLTILLRSQGKVSYPDYRITKFRKIYCTRADLLRFQEAWNLHHTLNIYVESKNWEDVCRQCEECVVKMKELLNSKEITAYDKSLPTFLRAYTAGSVLVHAIWIGTQGYLKSKQYSKCNEVIEFLLSQTIYWTTYRGRMYERLVTNAKFHLKHPSAKICCLIKIALKDLYIQDSHKIPLICRFEKIQIDIAKKSKKMKIETDTGKKTNKLTKEKSKVSDETEEGSNNLGTFDIKKFQPQLCEIEIPERTIQGEKLTLTDYDGKSIFLNSHTASSVELFAMGHYREKGYTYGLHAEGAVPITLYGLLFWDIIYYDKITDVFISSFQAAPLDIHFEGFYNQRSALIEERLNNLRCLWSLDDAMKLIGENWENHFKKLSIVNWSIFPSLLHVETLINSMGLPLIAAICERLAKNLRYFRSGFPDLILWNGKKCIFVEVKGPGDSLSAKQSLWIRFLISVGAKAEVCLVNSVSNKRIRPN